MLSGCGARFAGISVTENSVSSRPARVIEDSLGGMGAVYLSLENSGCKAVMVDGKMTMRQVEGGVEIPGKGRFEFKPGSHHIMLVRLKQHLNEGDRFKVTLKFEKGRDVEVESFA